MAQRHTRNNHAKVRHQTEQQNATRGQKNDELEERAPLAGYEELYEISRSGRVFSRKTGTVLIGGYHHSPFIRITVKGAVVTLPKAKALAESWAAADSAK
jgi:hypothetical protein